jgi:hypothetical protein
MSSLMLRRCSRGLLTSRATTSSSTFYPKHEVQLKRYTSTSSCIHGEAASAAATAGDGGDKASWDWSSAVSERDVERAVRRINRRIETGVGAIPKDSRCLEDNWTWEEGGAHLRVTSSTQPASTTTVAEESTSGSGSGSVKSGGTLIFLHGFGDAAEHWRELTELLVRWGCLYKLNAVAPLLESAWLPTLLNPSSEKPVSKFAFKCNLYRYSAGHAGWLRRRAAQRPVPALPHRRAGEANHRVVRAEDEANAGRRRRRRCRRRRRRRRE